jgi:tight adherence protein B
MMGLATVLAAATVWLLVPAPARVARAGAVAASPTRSRRWRRGVWVLGGIGVLGVAVAAAGPHRAAWVGVVAVVAGTFARLTNSARHRRLVRRRRVEVARACQVLSGQLSIGQVPARALLAAAEECPLLERPAATQRMGGEVGAALREVARAPGTSGLLALAEAWEVSEHTGAPIAHTVGAVAADQRAEERLRAVTSAELAAPRATGRVLAALPLGGIGLAQLVGAHPIHLLFGTWYGSYLVLVSVCFASAGVVWIEAIADRAEPR